jgi:undecaprenyl-diphosphatase
MYISDSIILGAVQGITEFLPVSSTAHTTLCQKMFSLHHFGRDFNILLNLGTLLALIIYFFRDFLKIFFGGINFICNKNSKNRDFFLMILLANLPTIVLFGFLEFLDVKVTSAKLAVVNLIGFGILLYLCDRKPTDKKEFSFADAMKVGFAQMLSFFPGVSRLGICLSMCRYLGYSRRASFKFSMLLSIFPVMGACFLKSLKILTKNSSVIFSVHIISGVISAFVFGIISVYIIDRFLKKHTFTPIVIYRIIFGLLVFRNFLGN